MMKRLSAFGCVLIVGLIKASFVAAQEPSPSVTPGFGVDTTIADVRNVFSLVRAYLAKPDSSARTRGLWSTATEFDRTTGDITAWRANQGFPATVVGVIPAMPGDSVYIVRILYARADSAGGASPLAFQRLYAVRESGAPYAFRLSSAFPRMRTGGNGARRVQSHSGTSQDSVPMPPGLIAQHDLWTQSRNCSTFRCHDISM